MSAPDLRASMRARVRVRVRARRPRRIYAGFPWSERNCGQGALRAPAGYVCPCRWLIQQDLD